jgi:ferredoxin
LGNGGIVSMAKPGKYNLTKQYDTIGFVYPTYYYSITTYGGSAGNAVYQLYELLLKNHGIKINFGRKLRMFSNYVVMYDMSKKVDEITKKSNGQLVPIIDAIKMRKNNTINKLTKIFNFINKDFIKKAAYMDKDFTINDNCTGCGICEEVCPVKNIEMINNKPRYNHRCEQCVACIQFCPRKAINYKNVTQNRGRYTNPEINYKELSGGNKDVQ